LGSAERRRRWCSFWREMGSRSDSAEDGWEGVVERRDFMDQVGLERISAGEGVGWWVVAEEL